MTPSLDSRPVVDRLLADWASWSLMRAPWARGMPSEKTNMTGQEILDRRPKREGTTGSSFDAGEMTSGKSGCEERKTGGTGEVACV